MPDQHDEILRANLNLETSRIAWKELLRFFAGGSVIAVAANLDLLDVAVHIAQDDKAQIEQWMLAHQVARVSDAQAQEWLERDTEVWAVVVKPWVLVQPIS
jgi:hypothetical protein